MSRIICVTNRHCCEGDFLERLNVISKAGPGAIILREKDMTEPEYELLSEQAIKICRKNNTELILHTFYQAAQKLGYKKLHLPLPVLRELPGTVREDFKVLGSSVHSREEAVEAEALGCTYITAGHIFDTDCKKGLPGRGLSFLKEVCDSVSIPVYAIGGITPSNIKAVREQGAVSGCIMSSAMSSDIEKLLGEFDEHR